MRNPKSLLCPTDFSDSSLSVLRYAFEVARMLAAKVELLHVYHVPLHLSDSTAPQRVDEISPKVREAIERSFRDLIDELGEVAEGVDITTRLEVGVPYQKIVERAEQGDVDMVLIGTHGRSGLARLLLGSVAERTLRLSPKPVLSVPVG